MTILPRTFAPRRVVALGLTWRCHARETGETIGDAPASFTRDAASFSVDGRVVLPSRKRIERVLDALEPGLGRELARKHPDYPRLLDYEIELAFTVLGDGRLAWMLANDITVRTVQILGEGRPQRMDYWGASKSFPATLLLGDKMLVDESTPELELVLRVGDDVRQRGRTADLAYSVSQLRHFAGPLEPGDLVLTGTPAGVAMSVPRWQRVIADVLLDRWKKLGASIRRSRKSSRFLNVGDVIAMDAGPLGVMRAVVEEEIA